jgi:hypothetical protein
MASLLSENFELVRIRLLIDAHFNSLFFPNMKPHYLNSSEKSVVIANAITESAGNNKDTENRYDYKHDVHSQPPLLLFNQSSAR